MNINVYCGTHVAPGGVVRMLWALKHRWMEAPTLAAGYSRSDPSSDEDVL